VLFVAVEKGLAKLFSLALLICFMLICFYELGINHPITIRHSVYNTMMNNIGEIFTLISCFIYLTELMLKDEMVAFTGISMFWITTGILIEVVGIFLYLAFSSYIIKHNLDPDGSVYGMIMSVCTFIQYGLFSIGFLAKSTWKESRF
jgi:hypothetical protein